MIRRSRGGGPRSAHNELMQQPSSDFSRGAAYVRGEYVPIGGAHDRLLLETYWAWHRNPVYSKPVQY